MRVDIYTCYKCEKDFATKETFELQEEPTKCPYCHYDDMEYQYSGTIQKDDA